MSKVALTSAVLIALSACGGGGPTSVAAQTPQQQLASLEASGVIPKLDRSSDLAGPDVNGNGVRDDIDTLIAANYTAPAERAAATQLAKTFQASLVVDLSNTVAVRAVSTSMSRATHCIFITFTGKNGSQVPDVVATNIESVSVSTKARLLKYLAYAKALDGTSTASPDGDTCEK